MRFADNVIALKLRRIYDTATREQLAGVCPYKGLGTFEESDAAYFFGREQLVGELAARSVGFGLLGVVGPSGSGKSSLVLAACFRRWRLGCCRAANAGVAQFSGRAPGRWRSWTARCPAPGDGERLVLVVDQFEEVFTTPRIRAEQEAFIRRLVELASDPAVAVVVTIRADYTGHCSLYPEFAELLAANLVLVGPMTGDQLRRAIELPARRVGLRVESALVDALVGGQGRAGRASAAVHCARAALAGALRRLAALRRLSSRRGRPSAVRASPSRPTSSSRTRAGNRHERLRPAGRRRQEEGDAAVRRRVPLSEFDVDRDPTVASVLSTLTRDRLLTQDEGLVEIAHEALIREWPRFAGWLRDDAAGQELRGHLTQAAGQWSGRGRDPGDLYRGARLSAALDWSQGHDRALNALEREFLAESRVASERQLERQRRTNRRLRSLLAGRPCCS